MYLVDASPDFGPTSGRYAERFEGEFAKYYGRPLRLTCLLRIEREPAPPAGAPEIKHQVVGSFSNTDRVDGEDVLYWSLFGRDCEMLEFVVRSLHDTLGST